MSSLFHYAGEAETVVNVLEDPEDYKAFEIAVASDFDVQTAVERELVLRLASLLWRLRLATAIDIRATARPRKRRERGPSRPRAQFGDIKAFSTARS